MKKIIFTILAAAAMSAACTKFAEDVTPAYDSVAKPQVEANVCDDDSVTVVITAGENTSYYGYAVVVGTLEGVTAEKLVANGYAKDPAVLLQGEGVPQTASIKYSEETASVHLALEGLTPFTEYTVYAAAISPMGVASEVNAVTVKTTDGTEPALTAVDFAEKENVLTFTISFNDPVSLTGNGTAKATFYGENYHDATGALIIYKEVDIPADSISTSGKNLVVAVPASEYIPGAYVAVTYSAGIVKNGADAVNAAYENRIIGYDEQGEIQKKGIFGYYDYANWDFSLVDPATLPDEPEGGDEMEGEGDEEEEEVKEPVYFSDWKQLVMTVYSTSEYPLAGKTGDEEITIVNTEGGGRSVTYAASKYGVLTANTAGIMLSEAPAYGSTISFTVAEGSFYDIFGNVNNEFTAEDEFFCSYGYTLEDIVGSYAFTAQSAYGRGPLSGTWTIAESDKPEYGNVMFTEMFSTECEVNIYAYFDTVAGTLMVPSLSLYAEGEQYLYAFCSSDNSGNISDMDVYFSVPQPGLIGGQSCLFGDAAFDPATYAPVGFFEIYTGFQAVRGQAAAPAAAPARSSVRHQF